MTPFFRGFGILIRQLILPKSWALTKIVSPAFHASILRVVAPAMVDEEDPYHGDSTLQRYVGCMYPPGN